MREEWTTEMELLAQVVDELRITNTANIKYAKAPDPVHRPKAPTSPPGAKGPGVPAENPSGLQQGGMSRAFAVFANSQPKRGRAT